MKTTKLILTFILSSLIISGIQAQDIITKKDGSEIRAKVQEVKLNEIRYKIFGNDNSPIYTLSKSDIFMIKYENGDKDLFDNKATDNTSKSTINQTPAQNNTTNQTPVQNIDTNQPKTVSQEPSSEPTARKGYIGITLGAAFLTKDYTNTSSGGQFTINSGYLFKKNFGITGSFFGTSYALDNYDDASVGLIGMLVGPLFSTDAISKAIEIDARPTIGLGWLSASYNGESDSSDETSFIFGLGSSIRWNCSKWISISGNLDYYNGTVEDLNLSSFGISAGINFRF